MRAFSTSLSLAVLTAVLLTGCDAMGSDAAGFDTAVGTTADAHESNNKATLIGMVTGTAIVNYAKGAPSEWRSTVNVQGALADGTYDFYVKLVMANGTITNETLVCSFTIDGGGRQGCSADTDLLGFNTGEVRQSDGTVIASGTFARRGGSRL